MSVRMAASCCQPLHVMELPRGARMEVGILISVSTGMDRWYLLRGAQTNLCTVPVRHGGLMRWRSAEADQNGKDLPNPLPQPPAISGNASENKSGHPHLFLEPMLPGVT